MTRALFLTVLLCAAWPGLSKAQQASTPAISSPLCDNQSEATPGSSIPCPAPSSATPAFPASGQTGSTSQTTAPTPATVIDPKTGLPLTPAELREREIDKFDPTKRDYDFSGTDRANATQTDQQQDQQAGQPLGLPPLSQEKPLPGSVAAMNADAASDSKKPTAASASAGGSGGGGGGADAGADSDYTGPAVLSRSYTLSRPMVSRKGFWTASLSVNFMLDDGKQPVAKAGQNGGQSVQYQSVTSTGALLGWNLSGRHNWKRDQLGLIYSGSYSDYTTTTSLSGMNHSLNLDYSHVLSSRITLSLVQSGQQYSQNYSLENPALAPGASIANINLAASPSTEIVTGVTRESMSSASMTIHQTARLSYNLSGSYFITGRSQGVGMWGHQVGADVNYRWTSKATVGAYYSYTNYTYAHGIADSDSHGGGAIFSYAFNRRMQLQTRVGGTRIESLAFSSVPLPPQLAIILGEGSVLVNAYSLRWTSDISAQVVRDLGRNRTASVAYAHGESPGNGVLLTSTQQSITAGFSASLMRGRVPLSCGHVHSKLEATSASQLSASTTNTYYFATSRSIGHGLSGTFRFDRSNYRVTGATVSGGDYRISVGLTWGVPETIMRKI